MRASEAEIEQAPAEFTGAQRRMIEREARPMMRRALRRGFLAGMALGATLTVIVLWALS